MKNIGIMGGTFDPIHNGHLLLGKQAYMEYELDQVWFMPSGQPPHKKNHKVTEAAIRLEMTRLATKNHPGFCCSDFEVRRNGTTYTANTLELLRREHPDTCFFFIIGADSLYELEAWHEPERIFSQAVILAARREYEGAKVSMEEQAGYLIHKYHADIRLLHCQEVDIASASLRQMAALGKSLKKYVPQEIDDFIHLHHLYKIPSGEKNMNEIILDMRRTLKKKLNSCRYEHTISVSYIAVALAMRYGCSLEKSELAGLLHDCAKYHTDEAIVKKCEKQQIALSDGQLKAPAVLHAIYGEWAARHKYGIEDKEILGAIRYHTTGKPNMSLLEKIIFVADYIEPRRDKAANLPLVRSLAFRDLDQCVYTILNDTLVYLTNKGSFIDPTTNEAYEYYKELIYAGKGKNNESIQ